MTSERQNRDALSAWGIPRLGGLGEDVSFRHFFALVVALRFAWLSEWLRRHDEEMLEMEFDYFDVLAANGKNFSTMWGCL